MARARHADRGRAARGGGGGRDAARARSAGGKGGAKPKAKQTALGKPVAAPVTSSTLLLINRATEALEAATGLRDVIALKDKAHALNALVARKERHGVAHARAWALGQNIDRKIGELVRDLPQSKRGRKPAIAPGDGENAASKTEQLDALGLTSAEATRASRVAELDQGEFDARLEQGQARILKGKPAPPLHASSSAVGYSGDECSTPELYAELSRRALGGRIDLDPACNAFAANVIKPHAWYHKDDSGLDKPWLCETLYLNPPYSAELIKAFVAKLLLERELGSFKRAVVLVNASVETSWFQQLLGHCALVCFPSERIQFLYRGEPLKDSSNRYAQAIFYFGDQGAELFAAEFRSVGALLQPVRST